MSKLARFEVEPMKNGYILSVYESTKTEVNDGKNSPWFEENIAEEKYVFTTAAKLKRAIATLLKPEEA